MTLNQVIRRIKALALGHKQIREFRQGLSSDMFADQTAKYPAVLLQDNGGGISIAGHAVTLSYRMFLVDLVHVSEDTKDNQLDVQSDMLSVALDLVAQMNQGIFDDWILSAENSIAFLYENEGDLYAGISVDFSLRTMFPQNVCQVPAFPIDDEPIDTDMNVYDLEYISTGAEGTSLTIPGIKGKKIMLIIRDNSPLHKVSNNPDSTEYTWDNTTIGTGLTIAPENRFLILYRNY